MLLLVGFLSGIGLALVTGVAFVVLKLVSDPDRRPDRAVGLLCAYLRLMGCCGNRLCFRCLPGVENVPGALIRIRIVYFLPAS